MTVEAKSRLEIEVDEMTSKSKVRFGDQQIGFVHRIEIDVDVNHPAPAQAKLYFYLPKANIKVIDDQIEVFRVAGISVKEFADVVKERDEALAKIKSMENE